MHRRRNDNPARRRFRLARDGQVLLLSVVLLATVLGLVGSFVSYLGSVRKATATFSARAAARQAAQAGLEKALWCLNRSSGTDCGGTYGSSFTGETGASVGGSGYYTSSIETLNSSLKTVRSVGYWPSASNPQATVILKADASIDTNEASFHYGVQSGQGGFILGGNAYIEGNIYANGDVVGSNGAYVTGSAWVAGGTSLSPAEQSTNQTTTFTFAQSSPDVDIAQSFRLSASDLINKVSFYIRKVGSPSNATVRILADNSGVPSKTVIASGTLGASSVTTSLAWVDVSFATPPGLSENVTYWLSIDGTTDASDYWIIGGQSNSGYGNGQGMSSANWNAASPVWASESIDYDFKVWTGGGVTKIDNVDVQQDAHANTIKDLAVTGDAYYQTKTNSTVGGASHPGSADPGPQDLPISDGLVDQWKSEAAAGGTITGDVTYSETSQSLGPKKITGSLTVNNNATLMLTGTLHVQGDINLDNNVLIRLDPGYGAASGVIIADGKVTIGNNTAFGGSGTPGTYVLVLTTNPSLDPVSPAMTLSNNSANSIFYAGHGMISISNNASLKEVTAFKLYLNNNAAVQYESGLANVSFTSGPGGGWVWRVGSTREIR